MGTLTASQQEISYWVNKLFAQFEPELNKSIIENGVLHHANANETVMRPGLPIKSTMLLTEGLVKIYKEGKNGEEFFLYYIEPGQACALSMICALRNEKSDIAARTMKDSTFIMLPLSVVDTYIAEYKSWNYFVMDSYKVRFHEILESLSNVAFNGLYLRLEHYLEQQVKSFKTTHLRITHEEIAKDINSSRVVVSRLLKQMEDAGKVKLHRNSIEFSKN
jgi:CRP/FNR family transcriptional regulator